MATANLLRRSDDIELARLVLILFETVKRLEDKVDMLIIQRADEAPDTGAITLHPQNIGKYVLDKCNLGASNGL